MDWDRIKAVDILVLCNLFIPKEGTIESVSILPSEFGKERMKEEDFTGKVVVEWVGGVGANQAILTVFVWRFPKKKSQK